MPRVVFTQNLRRHVPCGEHDVEATTVRDALEAVFRETPRLRGYILDDQGAVRRHINVFVESEQIEDRRDLSGAVDPETKIYVMQAISGG